ncbi:MAG: class I SAM-dependent methyltransferase [Methylococcales bacterium]
MNIVYLEKDELQPNAVQAMQSVEVVLDIGCGIVPQSYIRPHTHICCEPYGEYVDHLQKKIAKLKDRNCSYVVLNMGWHEAVNFFPEKSVDTVFLVDVIEHLEKEEGHKLLALTEKIARKQVVVFTPLGFMPQYHEDGKDAWGLNGADWQEHKSGWLPEDFSEDWQFFIAKEFHLIDNLLRPLEKPYGAFWAIKTYPNTEEVKILTRENALKNIEAELLAKEAEINSLIFTRIERKLRRIFKKILSFPRRSSVI